MLLTMVTLALRRSRFSSCRALHLSLNVSSSILRTLFSCCSEARRFVSSSNRNCEITMLGFPELEAEDDIGVAELLPAPSVSLSLALSAMVVRQCVWVEETTAAAALRSAESRMVHRVTLHTRAGTAPPAGCLQYCPMYPWLMNFKWPNPPKLPKDDVKGAEIRAVLFSVNKWYQFN